MYLEHFGLRDKPFSLTPDTGFYFRTPSSQEAFNVLLVALNNEEGLVKVSGEVGTGKTLLCRKLLNELPESVVTVFLPNPLLQPQQLYRAVAAELGVETADTAAAADLVEQLQKRLIALRGDEKRVVVCVDEAQSMPTETLEALRLLSNVETEKRKLLQIVLFGQPELDERLSGRALRQLRQRIGFSYRLQPLDYATTRGYLQHRLYLAGYRGAPLFSTRAERQLFKASKGIPRLINILAHKALLAAYGRGLNRIGVRQVQAAIADTEGLSSPPRWPWRALWVLVLLGGVVLWSRLPLERYL
ncbi:MAG: AAA family ATPase [Desulfuromonadaceae bacterium]|nr:AAA family ATPase [Desulfuromonadaceae bacterium]